MYGFRVYATDLLVAEKWRNMVEPILTPWADYIKCLAYQVEQGRDTQSAKRAEHDGIHLQGFIELTRAIRWTEIKDNFPPGVSFRGCKSASAAFHYCTKEDTRVAGPFSFGSPPVDKKETAWKSARKMLVAGKTPGEVIAEHDFLLGQKTWIDNYYKYCLPAVPDWRNLTITWLWGKTGLYKSRLVWESYPNLYPKDDDWWFDGYTTQDVVLFEEFYGKGIPLSRMLRYLDGYKCMLPVKGAFMAARYTKVFITSNDDPRGTVLVNGVWRRIYYPEESDEKFEAFMRRINTIIEIKEDISGAEYLFG